jgi:hypothetical protein
LIGTMRSLIPRRILFDNPTFFGAKISPGGRWISWLAPVDGVLNLWMAQANDIKAGEPVTRTKGRPINWQDWSADGRFLMFLNDETGDENRHLFVVDPMTHAMRDVTPLANISVQLSLCSLEAPGGVAVKINDRDARWHDLYRERPPMSLHCGELVPSSSMRLARFSPVPDNQSIASPMSRRVKSRW